MSVGYVLRDYFVYVPNQWETKLQCNVVSHWLGAYTERSLCSACSLCSTSVTAVMYVIHPTVSLTLCQTASYMVSPHNLWDPFPHYWPSIRLLVRCFLRTVYEIPFILPTGCQWGGCSTQSMRSVPYHWPSVRLLVRWFLHTVYQILSTSLTLCQTDDRMVSPHSLWDCFHITDPLSDCQSGGFSTQSKISLGFHPLSTLPVRWFLHMVYEILSKSLTLCQTDGQVVSPHSLWHPFHITDPVRLTVG